MSQNLGHEKVLTTFMSYGQIDGHRQGEIIRELRNPNISSTPQFRDMVLAMAVQMQSTHGAINH